MLHMRFLFLLFFVGLAACEPWESVSPEQCQAGDWVGIGLADGKAGRSETYITRHQEACAKIGISPNVSAWRQGRTRGLASYCTLQNAYEVGRKGNELSSVCPASAVIELNRANAKGRKYYAIDQEISSLRRQASHIDTELFFLGTAQDDAQRSERRQLVRQQERLRARISQLQLERIDYSVL